MLVLLATIMLMKLRSYENRKPMSYITYRNESPHGRKKWAYGTKANYAARAYASPPNGQFVFADCLYRHPVAT